MIKSVFGVLLGLAFGINTTTAQWEVGGWGGISTYWGDLNSNIIPHKAGPSAGLLVRRNFDGRICLRLGLNYANVGDNDKFSKDVYYNTRNLSFQTDIFELATLVEFNFLDYNGLRNRENKKFTSYLLGGPSLFFFNPKAKYEGSWYKLRPLGTEGQAPGEEYAVVAPAIILGGGFKFKIGDNWNFNFEIMHRILFTDYLDDVSKTYADKRVIEGYRGADGFVAAALSDRSGEVSPEPIGEPGRQRGDSKHKDAFMTIGIGFSYYFMNYTCPAY